MTHTETEEALENFDRRMSSVEQILPTLAATKDFDGVALKKSCNG